MPWKNTDTLILQSVITQDNHNVKKIHSLPQFQFVLPVMYDLTPSHW